MHTDRRQRHRAAAVTAALSSLAHSMFIGRFKLVIRSAMHVIHFILQTETRHNVSLTCCLSSGFESSKFGDYSCDARNCGVSVHCPVA